MNLVNEAWLFAKERHKGQVDDDGIPYFNHPIQVADLLRVITDDEDVIAASLLHDTLEDTDTTYTLLEQRFGRRVADLVNEVTHEGKLDQVGYYFPRLKTRDGVLIKFADRLSNLSRMDSWTKSKQEQYLRKSKFWRASSIRLGNKDLKVIFECRAGSHLYGTATDSSDVDTRGVFIPSEEYFLGFLHNIEQIETKKEDTVHFEIRKFLKLASECNPNIVELLFVPEEACPIRTEEWILITDQRELFLSKKARWTFSGYAISQLHRIQRHRNWLLHPPKSQPLRSDFGLPMDKTLVTKDQVGALDELLSNFNKDLVEDFSLDLNTLNILQKEKAFLNANKEWSSYQNWAKTRNPQRADLESRFGYDTKHGAHLYRLITEGRELLLTGKITFPRPDATLLLDIRNGKYSYDELMDLVGDIDTEFDKLYKESSLPNKPSIKKIDSLCISITKRHLAEEDSKKETNDR